MVTGEHHGIEVGRLLRDPVELGECVMEVRDEEKAHG
jgi:hypothetical protein